MRDPYVELGVGIIGQAIRDWRLESEKCCWKPEKDNPKLLEITNFLLGDFAQLCLSQVDIDPIVILQKLRDENVRKREEHERGLQG